MPQILHSEFLAKFFCPKSKYNCVFCGGGEQGVVVDRFLAVGVGGEATVALRLRAVGGERSRFRFGRKKLRMDVCESLLHKLLVTMVSFATASNTSKRTL